MAAGMATFRGLLSATQWLQIRRAEGSLTARLIHEG